MRALDAAAAAAAADERCAIDVVTAVVCARAPPATLVGVARGTDRGRAVAAAAAEATAEAERVALRQSSLATEAGRVVEAIGRARRLVVGLLTAAPRGDGGGGGAGAGSPPLAAHDDRFVFYQVRGGQVDCICVCVCACVCVCGGGGSGLTFACARRAGGERAPRVPTPAERAVPRRRVRELRGAAGRD